MWRFSGANTMSLMSATSAGVSWLELVLGHEERSSKPQTAVEARFHLWYRPDSRRAIRKIMVARFVACETAERRRNIESGIGMGAGSAQTDWQKRNE